MPAPSLVERLLDALRGLPREDRRSLWYRIRLRLRRGFRQGLGHWVLGIVLLGISLGGLRAWWRIDLDYELDVLERVDALLGTMHEPGHDARPGLLSAVLTPINRVDSRRGENFFCK